MNKYMGFYELKSVSIPTVPWKELAFDTELDDGLLWTIRVAVEQSDDINLPRIVGVNAAEAISGGKELLDRYAGKGMVIYYPYFIAEKSGVLDLSNKRTVIEAVDGDLWNLVTFGRKNVTIVLPDASDVSSGEYHGDHCFLDSGEIFELTKNAAVIRGRFRDELNEGKSIFAEWSFAYNTNTEKIPVGDRYLVFYELRSF